MRHHDRGIQRSKIEGSNGYIVVSLDRLDDCSSFVLVVGTCRSKDAISGQAEDLIAIQDGELTFAFQSRNEVPRIVGLSVQLRNDLDLLSSRQQIIEWHSRDTRHLGIVDEAHQFVHQPLW